MESPPARPSISTLDTESENGLNTPPSDPDDADIGVSIRTSMSAFADVPRLDLHDFQTQAKDEDEEYDPYVQTALPRSRTMKIAYTTADDQLGGTDSDTTLAEEDPWVTVDTTLSTLPISSEDDDASIVYDFFTEDNGDSLLAGLDRDKSPRPLSGTSSISQAPSASPLKRSRLSRHFRAFSAMTDNTIAAYDAVVLSLAQLCDVVHQHLSLQRAEVVSTEGYVERLGVIVHRFVLLELRRPSRRPVFLRLDRRMGKRPSTLNFLRSNGSTPSNDVAQFAATKLSLVGSAQVENRQVFDSIPTMSELRYFLIVISQELQIYQVWPANCWFFCSLLQQHLEGSNSGRFVDGSLQHANLARDIRHRIKERLRLFYHIPQKLSITSLLVSIEESGLNIPSEHVQNALDLSLKWDFVRDDRQPSTRELRLAAALGTSLLPVLAHLRQSHCSLEERLLWKLRTRLYRSLFDIDAMSLRHLSHLAFSLFHYAVCLHESPLLDDFGSSCLTQACEILSEEVGIRRLLAVNDDKCRPDLGNSLYNYGICLGEAGRTLEACKAEEEAVAIRREIVAAEPTYQHRGALAQVLYNYGLSLAEADTEGLLDSVIEACAVLKESVWLRRELQYGLQDVRDSRYSDRWRLELPAALNAYGWALHCSKQYEDAYEIKQQAVDAYRASPAHRPSDLASALHNFGVTALELNRLDQARAAFEEAVVIRRRYYEMNREGFWDDYRASAEALVMCLQDQGVMKGDDVGSLAGLQQD